MAALSMLVITSVGGGVAEETGPAKIEPIPGSDVKRVVLTPKAAERLDIQTFPLSEELVKRRIVVVGQVRAETGQPHITGAATDAGVPESALTAGGEQRKSLVGTQFKVLILLDHNALDDDDDFGGVDDEDDAEVLAPDDDDDDTVEPLIAKRMVVASANGNASDIQYFKVQGKAAQVLYPGQSVGVRLVEPGSGTPKKVVPYSAILYDAHGEAWVYTNPEALAFVRHRVSVEHVDDDKAVLGDGPDVGTKIVTVGAAELFGAELGVGH
jgi:hypothetical protein